MGDHLDADAGEGAAFGEAKGGCVAAKELELGGGARPEHEGEREGAGIFTAND
jgi:hypothetical protein